MSEKRGQLRIDHLHEDLGGRSVRGGAVALSGQALRFLFQLGATAVLARVLLRDDFGLVAMVTATTGILLLVKDFGLGDVTVQHEEIEDAEVTTLFWVGVAFSAAAALIVLALAPLLAWFFERPELFGITAGMTGVFFASGLGVQHRALLQRQMRFGRIAAIELGALIVGQASAVVAALAGAGYWALVLMPIVTALAQTVGAWWACPWRPGKAAPLKSVRGYLGFGSNLTGAQFFNYIARNADDVIIGRLFGAGSLALYSKAYQLLMLPIRQVNQPIHPIAVSTLGRLTSQPDRYRDTFVRIVEKTCLVTIPGAALMIVASDWIILTVLGPQWSGAGELLAILGLAALVQPLANATGWLFITQKRTASMRRWSLVGGSLTMIAFVAGIPWGVRGMALSYAVSGLLVRTPILFWWVGRAGPVRAGDIWRCALAGACGGVGVLVTVGVARDALDALPAPFALAAALPIALIGGLAGVAASPAGRAVVVDSLHMVRVLFGRRRNQS
ncbi:MAG: lipopolysaccharide biosynthesis protein [Planctomycetota bacterium]